MSTPTYPLTTKDRWALAFVATLVAIYVGFQVLSGYNAALHDANIRFRNKAEVFSLMFFNSLHSNFLQGENLWIALNDAGDNITHPAFENLCAQLMATPELWERLEVVITTGPHPGRHVCGSVSPHPLNAQDKEITALTAARRETGAIVSAGSTQADDTSPNPRIEWMQSIGNLDAQGHYTPIGYNRLVMRLGTLLKLTQQHATAPGEYALSINEHQLSTSDEDAPVNAPSAPALASHDWEASAIAKHPKPLLHWNNWYYPAADGSKYNISLFQRSEASPWLQWGTRFAQWNIVLATLLILAIALLTLTYGLLKARRRLYYSVRVRTERLARRARALQQAKLEQTYLQTALVDSTERERLRLGHELHDGVGQSLTGALLLADSLAQKFQPSPPALTALQQSLQIAIEEVRTSARNLTPAALLIDGFAQALEVLASTYEGSGVRVGVKPMQPQPILDADQSLNLYRMTQEAITNAIRHGQATQIEVVFGGADCLRVTDNGAGFDINTQPEGVGMRSQKLRAELLQRKVLWTSTLGHGTTMIVL